MHHITAYHLISLSCIRLKPARNMQVFQQNSQVSLIRRCFKSCLSEQCSDSDVPRLWLKERVVSWKIIFDLAHKLVCRFCDWVCIILSFSCFALQRNHKCATHCVLCIIKHSKEHKFHPSFVWSHHMGVGSGILSYKLNPFLEHHAHQRALPDHCNKSKNQCREIGPVCSWGSRFHYVQCWPSPAFLWILEHASWHTTRQVSKLMPKASIEYILACHGDVHWSYFQYKPCLYLNGTQCRVEINV